MVESLDNTQIISAQPNIADDSSSASSKKRRNESLRKLLQDVQRERESERKPPAIAANAHVEKEEPAPIAQNLASFPSDFAAMQ
jgi:hypothetical protein